MFSLSNRATAALRPWSRDRARRPLWKASLMANPQSAQPPALENGLPPRVKAQTHEPQDVVPHTAASRAYPARQAPALERAQLCAQTASDNRGRDVVLLDLRGATPLIDYFVIATAASRRQANAIAEEIDKEMKRIRETKLGIEGAEEGRWILIDYGDFVVHVFSDEMRDYYRLEDIWGDAPKIEWREERAPANS